jgi:CHAT domain-containing protein
MMAGELANILLRNRYALIPNGGALLDESATLDELLLALADEKLTLWVQMGHGVRPTVEGAESTEYLALAGTNRMMPQQLARLRLESTVVHLDCCLTGTTRWKGGGRFVGHPTAVLLAGASCVLSSVHALFDDTAAEFSARLYNKTLREQNPMSLGEALFQTQREMAMKYHDNPIVWATTVVWGNPWVQLT